MAKKVKVFDFRPGMAIEAKFLTPSEGTVVLDLFTGDDARALHLSCRWGERALVLNSHMGGSWGREERPGGFEFSSGVVATLRVEAEHGHFNVLQNGKLLHKFNHRLPVHKVKKISWTDSTSCAKQSKLLSITVSY